MRVLPFLLTSSLVLTVPVQAAVPGGLVVFGDSYSDTGLAWQAFQSQGVNLPQAPYYLDGRFSNGPVAVERMAQTWGVALDSRAWGGATTGQANILATSGPVAGTGMQWQVAQYLGEQPEAQVDAGALYVLWAGANDLVVSPSMAVSQQAAGQLMQALDTLYAAGARSFLVPLMPDLSQLPMIRGLPTAAAYAAVSQDFNARLLAGAQALRAAHADAAVHTFDTPAHLAALAADPGSGISNTTSACATGDFWAVTAVCAQPGSHMFWDGTHFSAATHAYLGHAMAASVPEPSSAALLLLGGAGVGAWRLVRRRAA